MYSEDPRNTLHSMSNDLARHSSSSRYYNESQTRSPIIEIHRVKSSKNEYLYADLQNFRRDCVSRFYLLPHHLNLINSHRGPVITEMTKREGEREGEGAESEESAVLQVDREKICSLRLMITAQS